MLLHGSIICRKRLFGILILKVNHKSACVTTEAIDASKFEICSKKVGGVYSTE